jgi:methionine-rich copper-binding protein CopC
MIRFQKLNLTTQILAVMILLAGLGQAAAQPTIVSTVPTSGATGVSPGAAVVFNFSTAMDPAATFVVFSDVTASNESPTVVLVWSAGNTALTCTPSPQFANNHKIQWNVLGQDTVGNFLTGTTSGSFTTVMGVNGGSGTNAQTTFLLGKYALYRQTTNAPPPLFTYEFVGQSTLASNRTATAITLTIPATPLRTNVLAENLLQPEQYQTNLFTPNVTNLDTNFPAGNYIFSVTNGGSNQQVTVSLPNYSLPNAPQIINYTNAQVVNPSHPFTLFWNTFTNGGSADRIVLQINEPSAGGNSGLLLFQTSYYGPPAGLDGTATSVTIPAGVLPANSTNDAFVVFAHVASTNNVTNQTTVIVGSATYFTIVTTNASVPPALTIIHSGTNVLLEWPTNATGYTLRFASNLTSAVWSTNLPAPVVLNTNNVVTNGISGLTRFYRLASP